MFYHEELKEDAKIRKLNDLLDALDFNKVVVFVKTKQRASALDKMLQKCFFPSMCNPTSSINGNLYAFFEAFTPTSNSRSVSIATKSSRNIRAEFSFPPTSLDVVSILNA